MTPQVWGPPIWTLFHTFAEKIKESEYSRIGLELYGYIRQICGYLPCPECSQHATRFLSSVKIDNVRTKDGLIKIMYVFHNVVNARKKKPIFPFENLDAYKNKNVVPVFNNFVNSYRTSTGNMKLITDSFQRQMILNNFRKWFLTNYRSFN